MTGLVVLLAAMAQPPAVPPAAQKAAQEASARVDKARKAFEAEAKKAQDELITSLTATADAEAKKNNRNAAALLRAEIDRLRRLEPTDLAPAPLSRDVQAFPGLWQVRVVGNQYKATWAAASDGTILRTDGAGRAEGRWMVEDRWKLLVVVWQTGGVDMFPLPVNPVRTIGKSGKETVEIGKVPGG